MSTLHSVTGAELQHSYSCSTEPRARRRRACSYSCVPPQPDRRRWIRPTDDHALTSDRDRTALLEIPVLGFALVLEWKNPLFCVRRSLVPTRTVLVLVQKIFSCSVLCDPRLETGDWSIHTVGVQHGLSEYSVLYSNLYRYCTSRIQVDNSLMYSHLLLLY